MAAKILERGRKCSRCHQPRGKLVYLNQRVDLCRRCYLLLSEGVADSKRFIVRSELLGDTSKELQQVARQCKKSKPILLKRYKLSDLSKDMRKHRKRGKRQ